jgi:hypothetical protein
VRFIKMGICQSILYRRQYIFALFRSNADFIRDRQNVLRCRIFSFVVCRSGVFPSLAFGAGEVIGGGEQPTPAIEQKGKIPSVVVAVMRRDGIPILLFADVLWVAFGRKFDDPILEVVITSLSA